MVKTRKIALDSMLAAMCAALGYAALDFNNLKITFESLPILLGALLLGPVDGMAIGVVGTLIYQLIRYGVSATTLLWILPYALCGLLAGWAAERSSFRLSPWKSTVVIMGCELMVTLLNTVTMYIDSKMYGYYFPGFIMGGLTLRLVICVTKGAVFSAVLPQLTATVGRTMDRQKN